MGVAFFLRRRPRLSYGGGVGVDCVDVLVLVSADMTTGNLAESIHVNRIYTYIKESLLSIII